MNFIKLTYLIFPLAFVLALSCSSPKNSSPINSYSVISNSESDCYPIQADNIFNKQEVVQLLQSSKPDSLAVDDQTTVYFNLLGQDHVVLVQSQSPPVNYYYSVQKDSLKQLLCYDRGAEFMSDSLVDINGDELLDVLVNYHQGGNELTQIFLQNRNGFVQPLSVFNVQFLPKQILRGYLTNQSPIVEYYTLQLKQNEVDTLSLIYFNESTDSIWSSDGKVYKSLPEEYRNLILH